MQDADPKLIELLRQGKRILLFTGAGISTGSGIPDFRGPEGVWKRRQPVYYHDFMRSEAARIEHWEFKLEGWAGYRDAKPNATHEAIVRLEKAGKVEAVVTQNIDGLHQKAGVAAERVIELHGSMFSVVCVSCGDRSPMKEALARVEAGEADPDCPRCGGILKSATVMFGQRLDPGVFARAERAARGCDLFLAVGSTLTVEPAASLCGIAAASGAALVIVNAEPTPYDTLAAEVIREPIGTAVPRITRQLLGNPRGPGA